MKCTTLKVEGATVIVCGSSRLKLQKCKCGAPATKLCDWIVKRWPRPGRKKVATLTCDAPVCDGCATSPEPGKDLCQHHGVMWAKHPANAAVADSSSDG
jgi:hypothetical protein